MKIKQLLKIIESSHLNFLFGAGLSCPFLEPLGPIEKFLTLACSMEKAYLMKQVRFALLLKYFRSVMEPCLANELNDDLKGKRDYVISCYSEFLKIINCIVSRRRTNLLDKQINIFTTNIDNFVELAAEHAGVEFNDGFKGHLNPVYSEDTFSQVMTRVSPLYHTPAIVPVFNYLKIHGSITWKVSDEETIGYDHGLSTVSKISSAARHISTDICLYNVNKVDGQKTEKEFNEYVKDVEDSGCYECTEFMDEYKNLVMINPRKAKFRESVIDNHFYELMRLYSNALEKPNSVLFVAGFSFADEHISKITLRAANSNPTLLIVVFAYSDNSKEQISDSLLGGKVAVNNNIVVITAQDFILAQGQDRQGEFSDLKNFSLESINKFVFSKILCCL